MFGEWLRGLDENPRVDAAMWAFLFGIAPGSIAGTVLGLVAWLTSGSFMTGLAVLGSGIMLAWGALYWLLRGGKL